MGRVVVQQPIDLINLKREHVKRLANQNGAAGEAEVLATSVHCEARPKGRGLDTLMGGSEGKRHCGEAIEL
jgi:hypothetical protein